MTRLLRSIEGVSEVEAPWLSADVRLAFTFQGEPCVVKNDSDRYWVGPANVLTSKLDLTPVHQVFQAQRHSALRQWAVDFDSSNYGGLAPGEAFAVAVVACFAYISVLDNLPSAFLRNRASPILELSLVLLPVVCCGLFHFAVVRNSDLSKWRQWLQTAAAALFAPLFGWLLALSVYG